MRRARLLLIPAVVLLAAGCGNEDTSPTSASDSTPTPASDSATDTAPYDPQLFCSTTLELERAGEKNFSSLDRNSTEEEYEAAERTFVLDNAELLDTFVSAAPTDLADEIDTFLTAMRQRAGLADESVTQREATRAEKAILAFENQHC